LPTAKSPRINRPFERLIEIRNSLLDFSHFLKLTGVPMTIPDYVAVGVLAVSVIWAVAHWLPGASYDQGR
jgi:hypothetical protein